MEQCLVSRRHQGGVEKVRDSGRERCTLQSEVGPNCGVTAKCREEKLNLICEECAPGQDEDCGRDNSTAQGGEIGKCRSSDILRGNDSG